MAAIALDAARQAKPDDLKPCLRRCAKCLMPLSSYRMRLCK